MMRALRRWAKRVSASVLALLLGLGRRRTVPQRIRSVLVIRIDPRVGNVLLTTPLLRALQDGLPEAEVRLLVAPSKAGIVHGLAPTIPFDKKALHRRPLVFFKGLLELRRARYDVVIDASHWHTFSVTSAALLAWTGAPIRIAHARGAAHRFANQLAQAPSRPEWEIDTKLRLLQPLGLVASQPRMLTSLGLAGAQERMQAWLQGQGPGPTRWIGLAPGARKLDHRASPELFAALGDQARALGYGVLVLWGPGEEALADRVATSCAAVLAPPTSLDELAALMRACDLVVANDTGPMHLCVACETQTLGLFQSADPVRWGHERLGHIVVAVGRGSADREQEEALAALRHALGQGPPSS